MSEDTKPKHDEFTAKVVNDPAQPQETLLLQGFLGASSQPDHTRVYSDLSLESYVDVANADIIHIEPLPKEQSPLGGSYLWVKKDADVFPSMGPGTATAKAKFLEGPIAAESSASAPAAAAQPQLTLPKTGNVVRCNPTILVQACAPVHTQLCNSVPIVNCPTNPAACHQTINGPECPVRTPLCPAQPASLACGEQQFAPADFGVAAQGPARMAAPAPDLRNVPSIGCPTAFCPPPQTAPFHCVPHTPGCPQIAVHPTVSGCHHTVAASVCHVCPSVQEWNCPTAACHQTVNGPECPVHTQLCPAQQASVGCGEQIGGTDFAVQAPAQPAAAAQPPRAARAATQVVAQCVGPVTVATCPSIGPAVCVSVAGAICPTQQCPTPLHRCPSELCPTPAHQCPSVQGFHCPSVAGFDCPSAHGFQCPSVNNFHCPPPTVGAHCLPTPNIQHCPTPNMICPRPTPNCPSVADVCQTSSPLFC